MASVHAGGAGGIPLLPGEHVAARLTANNVKSGRGCYEGYLFLTTLRLVHRPWPAAESRGAVPFYILWSDVAGADAAPRGRGWRDGSIRRRLRIALTSGEAELFVVWRVNKSVGLVERVRREAGNYLP
jgi:hypothetical protein